MSSETNRKRRHIRLEEEPMDAGADIVDLTVTSIFHAEESSNLYPTSMSSAPARLDPFEALLKRRKLDKNRLVADYKVESGLSDDDEFRFDQNLALAGNSIVPAAEHRESNFFTEDDGVDVGALTDEDENEDSFDLPSKYSRSQAPRSALRSNKKVPKDLADFVADSDEESEESSDYDDPRAPAFSHRLNPYNSPNDAASSPVFSSYMDDKEAFIYWIFSMGGCLISPTFWPAIMKNRELHQKLLSARKTIEEQFETKTETWVKSQFWDRKDTKNLALHLRSMPYSRSQVSDGASACEICPPKRGQGHASIYRLKFFGVQYDYSQIRFPFKPEKILPPPEDGSELCYRTHSFEAGELCHQRLKLYHAMIHFKLHVLLILMEAFVEIYLQRFQPERVVAGSDEAVVPISSAQSLEVLEYFFVNRSPVMAQLYSKWQYLNSLASEYSSKDSRAAKIRIDHLETLYNFDSERCALRIFDWHTKIGIPSRELENWLKSFQRSLTKVASDGETILNFTEGHESHLHDEPISARSASESIVLDESDADSDSLDIEDEFTDPRPLPPTVESTGQSTISQFFKSTPTSASKTKSILLSQNTPQTPTSICKSPTTANYSHVSSAPESERTPLSQSLFEQFKLLPKDERLKFLSLIDNPNSPTKVTAADPIIDLID